MEEEEREEAKALSVLEGKPPEPTTSPITRTLTDLEDPLFGGDSQPTASTSITTTKTKYTLEKLEQEMEENKAKKAKFERGVVNCSKKEESKRKQKEKEEQEEKRERETLGAMKSFLKAGASGAGEDSHRRQFFIHPRQNSNPLISCSQQQETWKDIVKAGFWPNNKKSKDKSVIKWLLEIALNETDVVFCMMAKKLLESDVGSLISSFDFHSISKAFEDFGCDTNSIPTEHTAELLSNSRTVKIKEFEHNICILVQLIWTVLDNQKTEISRDETTITRKVLSYLVGLASTTMFIEPSTPIISNTSQKLHLCIDKLIEIFDANSLSSLKQELIGKLTFEHSYTRISTVLGLNAKSRTIRLDSAWELMCLASDKHSETTTFSQQNLLTFCSQMLSAAAEKFSAIKEKDTAEREFISILKCFQICAIESGILKGNEASENARNLSIAMDLLSKKSKLAREGKVKEETLLLSTFMTKLDCDFEELSSSQLETSSQHTTPTPTPKQTGITSFFTPTKK